MPAQLIFFLEVGFGYLAWVLAFRTYGWPRLKGLERADALRAIATLHSFRFFGLAFLLPGVVGPGLPAGFARAAALGDFGAGVLAIAALLSFRVRPLFWGFTVAFNVWGLADLILDGAHGVQAKLPEIAGQLGGGFAILMLYVPLLAITHVAAFSMMLRSRSPRTVEARA